MQRELSVGDKGVTEDPKRDWERDKRWVQSCDRFKDSWQLYQQWEDSKALQRKLRKEMRMMLRIWPRRKGMENKSWSIHKQTLNINCGSIKNLYRNEIHARKICRITHKSFRDEPQIIKDSNRLARVFLHGCWGFLLFGSLIDMKDEEILGIERESERAMKRWQEWWADM